MTVKLIWALRQKGGITTDDFQKIWREDYGPFVASLQTPLNLAKYVQIFRTAGDLDNSLRSTRANLVQPGPPFDIVDEFYFDGTIDEFLENYDSPNGRQAWQALNEIIQKHLNLSQCHVSMVEERPFVCPSNSDTLVASKYNHLVRAVAFAKAAKGTESVEYWGRCHSALTKRWAAAMGLVVYVQNHQIQPRGLGRLSEDFGIDKSPYDICATMLFDERISTTNDVYRNAMLEIRNDENSGFMRPQSMLCFAGKDHVFVDRHRSC
ncbi:EthD domain-containing protein [Cladophialophora immunda]|nr:EthD domain-containing protein [Cladophialophora immunda]